MRSSSGFHRSCIVLILAFWLFISGGCGGGIFYDQPIHEINLSPINQNLNIHIGLVMTDEYRNAKWEKNNIILPVGENLSHHTELLMKRVFTHPAFSKATQNPSFDSTIKYIMKPKVAFIERSLGVTAFSEARTSVGVEWKITDLSGKAVWVETIKGLGVGTGGNLFTYKGNQREILQMALQDLFEKTQNAMLSSRVLRNLK